MFAFIFSVSSHQTDKVPPGLAFSVIQSVLLDLGYMIVPILIVCLFYLMYLTSTLFRYIANMEKSPTYQINWQTNYSYGNRHRQHILSCNVRIIIIYNIYIIKTIRNYKLFVLNYGLLLKNYIIEIMAWLCTMEESATRNNQACIVTGPISKWLPS
jgi:hypothetical protein